MRADRKIKSLMPNNVWIFLPLLLYGTAVLLGLCLCYFVAPRSKRKHLISTECQAIRLSKTKIYHTPLGNRLRTHINMHPGACLNSQGEAEEMFDGVGEPAKIIKPYVTEKTSR